MGHCTRQHIKRPSSTSRIYQLCGDIVRLLTTDQSSTQSIEDSSCAAQATSSSHHHQERLHSTSSYHLQATYSYPSRRRPLHQHRRDEGNDSISTFRACHYKDSRRRRRPRAPMVVLPIPLNDGAICRCWAAAESQGVMPSLCDYHKGDM